MATDLTQGSVFKQLLTFSLPYLLACFLQTFYGVADLFIAGQFNGASTITAISIGSQVMHMFTLMIAGLAMGVTVLAGRAFGARDKSLLSQTAGNSISLFALISLVFTGISLPLTGNFASLLQTPPEAFEETVSYMQICFLGIPFIAAYNVIAALCRGIGDSRHPMIFVAISGVFNIILDYIFIGPAGMGAIGAALATVIAQVVCVIIAILTMARQNTGIQLTKHSLRLSAAIQKEMLAVGVPTALQEGIIQVGFIFITAIANSRGIYMAASVGIVEKLICFFFLVPSSMLAGVSALSAQNRGAGLHNRSKETLKYGILTCAGYGAVILVLCQFVSPQLVGLFTTDEKVILYGAQYLRSYGADAMIAGIHFCFSGYFCAYNKAIWTFLHNVTSCLLVRIPGTWLAAVMFPLTLTPMGCAAPLGSIYSILVCILVYRYYRNTAFVEGTQPEENKAALDA